MVPDPIEEKYYQLTNKNSSSPALGLVSIAEKGFLYGRIIFRTGKTPVVGGGRTVGSGLNWYLWDQYSFEYVGDLA